MPPNAAKRGSNKGAPSNGAGVTQRRVLHPKLGGFTVSICTFKNHKTSLDEACRSCHSRGGLDRRRALGVSSGGAR